MLPKAVNCLIIKFTIPALPHTVHCEPVLSVYIITQNVKGEFKSFVLLRKSLQNKNGSALTRRISLIKMMMAKPNFFK